MRLCRVEPSTFLTPTSLALPALRAVDRFIKLIQAISRINTAIVENIYTYWILPLPLNSAVLLEWRWMEVSGVSEYFIKLPLFANWSMSTFMTDRATGTMYLFTIWGRRASRRRGSAPFFSTI